MKLLSKLPRFQPPILPDSMRPYVSWAPQCSLTVQESMAFSLAMQAFADEYLGSDSTRTMRRFSVILLAESGFTMQMDASDSAHYGKAMRIILLPIHIWRQSDLSMQAMIVCILEELCHIFYAEDDEIRVEDLVLACAKHLWPDVRKEELYNPNWMLADSR